MLQHHCKRDHYWLWGAFFIYIAFTLTSFAFYEPWRDEADSWLVAQDTTIPQLFHHLQFMGHQSLWYLILMPFAKAGLPYATIHIIHFLVIYTAVYLFLFYSPFPKLTKILFIFSFFMTFEYAIVARNYSLSILFLFLIAILYPKRFEKPVLYALPVFLLFHTNTINLAGAGLFFGEFIWEGVRQKSYRNRYYLLSVCIMLAGMVLAIYQLYPTAPEVSDTFKHAINVIEPYNFLLAVIDAMLGGLTYRMVVGYLVLAFFVFGTFMHLLSRDKKILLFLSVILFWLFYIFAFKYGGHLRHYTFILIYIVVGYWLSTYSTGKSLLQQERKNFITLLTVIMAYSSVLSLARHYESSVDTTSGSKAVAEYIIDNNYINDIIVVDRAEFSTSILPYLREVVPGKKLWFAYKKDFGSYSPFDADFWTYYTKEEIMQNIKESSGLFPKEHILVVLHYPLYDPEQYGLKEVFASRAIIRTSWNQKGDRSESYWLYRFN